MYFGGIAGRDVQAACCEKEKQADLASKWHLQRCKDGDREQQNNKVDGHVYDNRGKVELALVDALRLAGCLLCNVPITR